MRVFAQLREAILTRQQVVGRYRGHERVFCPHILGWKEGAERCLVYQFAGTSNSGPIVAGSPDNWRCLKLEKLEIIRLQPGSWYSGPSHERPSRCLDRVDVDSERPETLLRAAADRAGRRSILKLVPGIGRRRRGPTKNR